MPHDANSEAGSKRLILEMIDTPGINNATRSAGPIHERNLTEILAKVQDVGGISAIVLVVRYATPLSREFLDSTFASYLYRLTVHCKNLIVVHSHYFPQLALERGLPYFDLSDRIAAFSDRMQQTPFGPDVTATHLAMNNKHVFSSERYPAHEAFLYQQADEFLQIVMRYVATELDVDADQADRSVDHDQPPAYDAAMAPAQPAIAPALEADATGGEAHGGAGTNASSTTPTLTDAGINGTSMPLFPLPLSPTHEGWYLSAINKNNFFQCRKLKKQYDIACGVFNMTWERWQFHPVDGGCWTVHSKERNKYLTARSMDGYLDQVVLVDSDEQRFRILLVSDAPGQVALMTDPMWVGAKAMQQYSVHAQFEVLQDAMPLMWFPFIGGAVHVQHGSSDMIVQMSLRDTLMAQPAAATSPHDIKAQWVLEPRSQVAGAFQMKSRAGNMWIAARLELGVTRVAEDAAPIWVVLVDAPRRVAFMVQTPKTGYQFLSVAPDHREHGVHDVVLASECTDSCCFEFLVPS
ncbi:hypothetical protein GGF32_005693 [Allomyces javanicus]|nr:hypothetical protein GGF32_005693 [Allomyces javanicus]